MAINKKNNKTQQSTTKQVENKIKNLSKEKTDNSSNKEIQLNNDENLSEVKNINEEKFDNSLNEEIQLNNDENLSSDSLICEETTDSLNQKKVIDSFKKKAKTYDEIFGYFWNGYNN